MADDKIKLSIELEEGSVKKSFDNIRVESKKASKDIEKDFSASAGSITSNIAGIATGIGAVTAAIYTVKKAFESALDFALLGERVQSIEFQFKAIAQSAGVAADTLSEGLLSASRGLLDDEEILQFATKSIVALGDSAKALPAIFDQARIASKNLGTDFKDTAEAFSTFVETGNARLLKQFGLVIDTEKALNDYAKTLGLTASQLTVSQQQQIRINELLDTASKKFKDTTESSTGLKDSLTRLNVVFGNFIDDAAVKFSNSFGPSMTRVTDSLSKFISTASAMDLLKSAFMTAAFGTNYLTDRIVQASKIADDFSNASLKEMLEMSAKASEKVKGLGDEASILKNKISKIGFLDLSKIGEKFTLESQLKNVNKELEVATINASKLYSAISKRQDAGVSGGGEVSPIAVDPANEDQSKIILANKIKSENELNNFLLSKHQERLQFRQQELAGIVDFEAKKLETENLFKFQTELVDAQYRQKLLDVAAQFSVDKGYTLAQQKEAELAVTQSYNDQLVNLEIDRAKKIADIDKESSAKRVAFAKSISDTIKNTMVNGISITMQKLGESLVKGTASFNNFTSTVLGLMGDMAIQLGNLTIAHGIAATSLGQALATFNGAAAIAAGAALVVIGGAIKAMAGGTSTISSGASVSPSSGGGSEVSTQPVDVVEAVERPEAQTTVSVNIQGDVLDSEETGLRIVDILNSAFDKQGVIVKKGVLA